MLAARSDPNGPLTKLSTQSHVVISLSADSSR